MDNKHLDSHGAVVSQSGAEFGNSRDSAFSGGVTAGYNAYRQFNVPVRIELEYTAYDKSNINKSTALPGATSADFAEQLKIQNLMANFWLDLPTGSALPPYIGGGLGTAFIKYNHAIDYIHSGVSTARNDSASRETNFAWQLGAGVSYAVTDSLDLDLGYRYIDMGKVKSSNTSDVLGHTISYSSETNVNASEVRLGARYTF
jgi:opacity protein-like surface antigen